MISLSEQPSHVHITLLTLKIRNECHVQINVTRQFAKKSYLFIKEFVALIFSATPQCLKKRKVNHNHFAIMHTTT